MAGWGCGLPGRGCEVAAGEVSGELSGEIVWGMGLTERDGYTVIIAGLEGRTLRYGRVGAGPVRCGWAGLALLEAALWGGAMAAWGQGTVAPTLVRQETGKQETGKQEAGKPITKEQAAELFKSVDEILSFVSADSKLPIRHSVKRRLISRAEVGRFLKTKFDEDEGAKRMERSELVLKKFGLLDHDFQLRPFLISLLTEQIAGFYDNKTKTVNLLDWIEPEEQKPVLAHELTHALQDQAVGLEKWGDSGVHGISGNLKEDNRHLETDEVETVRGAVAEGQAMAVFVDYSLRATGRTLADSPEVANRLKDADMSSGGSPILARAPLLLQQSLLFPYTDGLSFEQVVLSKGGKQAAFGEMLAHPPSSSYEVMNPEAFLAHAPVPTLRLPDVHPMLDAEYMPYDIGVMGALDVRILAELFGGREMAEALTPAWDGGVYYAAQRRSATAAEKGRTASLAVFYLSRWKNPDSARTFARTYAEQLGRKYAKLKRVEADTKADTKNDEEIYTTEEGDVLVSRAGTDVFVSEGFALPLGRKLRDAVEEVQASGPVLSASGRTFGSAGACGAEVSLGLAGAWRSALPPRLMTRDAAGLLGSRDMLEGGRGSDAAHLKQRHAGTGKVWPGPIAPAKEQQVW